MRKRVKYTLAERVAIGRRTAATQFRREFAGIFIVLPVVLIAYGLSLPSWAGQLMAGLACCVGSVPLSRWLLGRILLRRANRSESS